MEFLHIGGEHLAVNLLDLDRIEETVRFTMFADKLVLTDTVWVDKNRVDEVAVVFKCPILQAACVLDIVRGRDRKAGMYPTRAYIRRGRLWVKLPGETLLTLIEDEKVVLNPSVFRVEARLIGPVMDTSVPSSQGGRKVLKRKGEG